MRRDIDGAIGWITLDNPARHNAMSLSMWEALAAAASAFDAEPAVRVVVLRGAGGKAFVSGADISEFEKARDSAQANEHYEAVGGKAMAALSTLGKPTIAMLNGYCVGGGMAIALCCDLRIAADDLRYGIPAARLGIGYGWRGIRKLVDVVGEANAREIFLTARRFDATHALRTGFAHRVVPAAALESTVREECAVLAANAPMTMRSVKVILGELARADAGIDVARCEAATRDVLASEDFVEGRRAFMEKRTPRFEGR